MPPWAIVLIALAISLPIDILILIKILKFRKESGLYDEMKRTDCELIDKCLAKDGFLECPGVIQIHHGNFILRTVFNKEYCIPVGRIRVLKESKSHLGKWAGKTVFTILTPDEDKKILVGIKNPEAWRKYLKHQ